MKEVKDTPEGNKILANCLERLSKIGHKETLIAIGNLVETGEYCSVGSEYPDEWVEYNARTITISNPLLKKDDDVSFVQNWAKSSLVETIQSLTDSSLAKEEAKLFKKHIQNNSDIPPMEIFARIMPYVKCSKETFQEVFNVAKNYHQKFLEVKETEVNDAKFALTVAENSLNHAQGHGEEIIARVTNFLSRDEKMNERDQIINMYM